MQAARAWLARHTNWLLVLDNAQYPAAVRDYLPQGGSGHVLITSQYPNWLEVASSLKLPTLERKDSIQFLLRRTGREDETGADALADALGNLPLALEQAGAYMEACKCSFSDFLTRFKNDPLRLLSVPIHIRPNEETVMTTWRLSFKQVREALPASGDLLSLCAYLAPDNIPRWLLKDHADVLPELLKSAVQDEIEFDKVLANLLNYSLIDFDSEFLSVHQMVQVAVQQNLPITR